MVISVDEALGKGYTIIGSEAFDGDGRCIGFVTGVDDGLLNAVELRSKTTDTDDGGSDQRQEGEPLPRSTHSDTRVA